MSTDSGKAAFCSINIIAPLLNNDFFKISIISEFNFDLIATLFEFFSKKILNVLTEPVYDIFLSLIDNALQYEPTSESNQALKSVTLLVQYAATLSASQIANDQICSNSFIPLMPVQVVFKHPTEDIVSSKR